MFYTAHGHVLSFRTQQRIARFRHPSRSFVALWNTVLRCLSSLREVRIALRRIGVAVSRCLSNLPEDRSMLWCAVERCPHHLVTRHLSPIHYCPAIRSARRAPLAEQLAQLLELLRVAAGASEHAAQQRLELVQLMAQLVPQRHDLVPILITCAPEAAPTTATTTTTRAWLCRRAIRPGMGAGRRPRSGSRPERRARCR